MPSTTTAMYAGQQLFLVEGALDSLYTAAGDALLIASLRRRSPDSGHGAGLCEAVERLQQAHDAAVPMAGHADDQVDVLIARLNGALVYGRLAHASELVEGERVRAVVAHCGAHLLVHSLIRHDDDLLLLPPGAGSATQARVRRHRRSVGRAIGGIWMAAALLAGLVVPLATGQWRGRGLVLSAMAVAAVLSLLVRRHNGAPAEDMAGGAHAHAIFAAYGFPLPGYFDATIGMTYFAARASGFLAPSARLALHKHKKTFNLFP